MEGHEERHYEAEYNIWGFLFPLLLTIFSGLGGYYFQSIGLTGIALWLYLITFSSAIALFVVTAKLWGYLEAARRLEEMAKKERIKRALREEEE